MLVLTRKIDEAIAIGNDIKVVLISIDGRQARIGVEAPPNVPIHRLEVVDRLIEEANQGPLPG